MNEIIFLSDGMLMLSWVPIDPFFFYVHIEGTANNFLQIFFLFYSGPLFIYLCIISSLSGVLYYAQA